MANSRLSFREGVVELFELLEVHLKCSSPILYAFDDFLWKQSIENWYHDLGFFFILKFCQGFELMMLRKDYCGNYWFNMKGKNNKKSIFMHINIWKKNFCA